MFAIRRIKCVPNEKKNKSCTLNVFSNTFNRIEYNVYFVRLMCYRCNFRNFSLRSIAVLFCHIIHFLFNFINFQKHYQLFFTMTFILNLNSSDYICSFFFFAAVLSSSYFFYFYFIHSINFRSFSFNLKFILRVDDI